MFCILSQTCQRKKFESPWGNKAQTFGFQAPMLHHWATETLWWARPSLSSRMTSSMHIARISQQCWQHHVPHGVSECFHFFLCPTLVTRHRFLCFFTKLKIYHLPHSFHHLYVMLFSRLWSGPHIWLPIQGHDADCGDPVVSCTRAPSWLQSTNHSCGYVGCGLYFWWAPWQ